MIRSLVIAASCLLLSEAAFAQQQQPDPAFLQRALVAMQQQRNAAMDAHAAAEASRAGVAEELAKAQARIKALEDAAAKPEK